MDSDNVSISAIKRARNVKRLTFEVLHEKGFRKRKSVGVLFDDVSSYNDLRDIPIGDFALAHSLFGMGSDAIAILGNGLPESRDVEFGHPTAPLSSGPSARSRPSAWRFLAASCSAGSSS